MNDKTIISLEDLKYIASNITEKRREIMDTYNSSLKGLLIESDKCLRQAGKSFEEEDMEFKRLFTAFDKSVTELTEVLTNKIIPGYENLSEELRHLFNKQFAGEIARLLELDNL